MARLALLSACARVVCAQDDDLTGETTDISDMLNAAIEGSGGFYTAGRGVLVRTPDFFAGDTDVVPATLWSNDIFTPSPLYPATGDPQCPTSGDGWSDQAPDCSAGSPWDRAIVAVVISSSMSNLFLDWDHIQDPDWGWGVFYGFDSNAADKRCIWRDDWGGYDCPGGFVDGNGVYTQDDSKHGPGMYPAGNPWSMPAGNGGGGAGCHFDGAAIDQMDADGMNLVQDSQCQCNYGFSDDWRHWVDTWMAAGTQKPGFEWRGWFWNGKAPTWAVDTSICWVNNIRDMIGLQNALYWAASDWSNQMMPISNWRTGSDQDRIYWGWNEIPVTTTAVEDPLNWDSIIIKLPADICGNGDEDNDIVWCLGDAQMDDLLTQLKQYESAGKLLKGPSYVTSRPGSYILFVREFRVGEQGWNRYFFCRHAVFADREILHTDVNGVGACFYDDRHSDEKSLAVDVI